MAKSGGAEEGGIFIFQNWRRGANLDLKESSDSAVTTSCSSAFQSGMVRRNNDICLYCLAGWDVIAATVAFSVAQPLA